MALATLGALPWIHCSATGTAAPIGAQGDAGSDAASDAGLDGAADSGSDAHGLGSPCRLASECAPNALGCGLPGTAYCLGPQESPCTGVALQVLGCMTDSDCDGAAPPFGGGAPSVTVCRSSNLEPAQYNACWLPCASDESCPPQDQCDVDGGHCVSRPCSACPGYFDCSGGTCAPRSCQTDADCAQGYCVNLVCQSTLGQCTPTCC